TFYLNLNRFLEKVMLAKIDGSFVKLLNHLDKASLLILDDFGLAPMDQNSRLALLQILEDRYNKKSVIIASQLPVGKWHEYLAEPTLADYHHFFIMRSNLTVFIVGQLFSHFDTANYFA